MYDVIGGLARMIGVVAPAKRGPAATLRRNPIKTASGPAPLASLFMKY